ncbi:Proteoglycan 4 C-terminal part like [Fagus crenata]
MSGLGFGAESPLTWAYRHTNSQPSTHADDRLPRPPTKVIQNSDYRTRPHFTSKFKLGLGACAVAMAQVSISKALMLVLVIVVSSVAAMVSAQDTQLAPAPAPTMDVGAAFSLPVSVALLGSSVLFTLLALLKL